VLCRFTFGNFRSFRDGITLDMRASQQRTPFQPDKVEGFGVRLLPAAVIYGPNASGKTNIVLAATTLQSVVASGLNDTPLPLAILPFIHEANQSNPMYFEIDFIARKHRYQYRLEIALSNPFIPSCECTIKRERLDFYYSSKSLCNLFSRDVDRVRISREAKSLKLMEKADDLPLELLEKSANDNIDNERLFLTGGFHTSICKTIAAEVMDYFKRDFIAIADAPLDRKQSLDFDNSSITAYVEDEESQSGERLASIPLFDHVKAFSDIGPQRIYMDLDKDSGNEKTRNKLIAEYMIGDSDSGMTAPAFWMESGGTLRMISFSPLVYYVLERGSTLIVDELDSSIHPEMIASLIAAFNDPSLNPKHAQLIFTSHNTAYLEKHMLRRDQILFVQKKEDYSSELYSLADFGSDTVRGDGSLLKQYLKGNFGALPLGSFSMALRKLREEQMEVPGNAS